MNWLAKYYDRRVLACEPHDFLRQVGHTENGRPISHAQFGTMLARIRTALELAPNDTLLDLCCGNGIFAQALARDVRLVVGIDFSKELIRLANANNAAENLTYAEGDVKRLNDVVAIQNVKFSKILMNAALQHFTLEDFNALLQTILPLATQDRVFLFTFVPDFNQRSVFEATRKRGIRLQLRRFMGRDLMGAWWQQDDISEICRSLGLEACFLPVDPILDSARYRFDCRIS